MRAVQFIGWALFGVAVPAAWAAADEFPYEAFVATGGVEIVSGPGQRYYATDRLERGTPVEVYREEASGWLAIRPPEGSFSWVAAEFVERSEDDPKLGRVTAATPSWIGTEAERVREHRQLVMLKADEVVKILGEKQVAVDDANEETWLKISPPAGEFRWIHSRDVSRQPPDPAAEEAGGDEPARDAQPVEISLGETALEDPEESVPEPRRIDVPGGAIAIRDLTPAAPPPRVRGGIEAAQFRSTTEPVASKPISPDGFVPRKRRGSEQLQTVPAPSQRLTSTTAPTFTQPRAASVPHLADARGNLAPQSASPGAAAGDVVSAGDLAERLQKLELDLSLMLAQDKSTWNLAGLRDRVNELVEKGSDPAARGQARLLLDKIKQIEESFGVQDFGPIVASSGGAPLESSASPLADPRYDGEGWLVRVRSKSQRDVPPFALVDRDSNPICFVTPAPGFNLSAYENRRIGVYGRRGLMEETNKPHVLAERAIDLDRQFR